jgi:uncharacterized LabA/DUF88 family protein
MKKIILIDGENFIHLLITVLRQVDPTFTRDKLVEFPVRTLLASILEVSSEDEVYYFGTKLRLNTAPEALRQKVEQTRAFQAKWTNQLAKQNITFMKAGYLRVREAEPCQHCGKQEAILFEKGVDVAIAVKAVESASSDREIVFVTSDTDLLPAFRSAKARGATVTYVGFEENIIIALAATATKTRSFVKETILKLGEGLHG